MAAHESPVRAEQVCAVVVTHRPVVARLRPVLAVLDGAVGAVILVDDCTPQWDPRTLCADYPALIVKQLHANAGIAAAQNEGIALARARNASHVLFLDQDSMPQVGMVAALKEGLERLEQEGLRVACVGPRTRFPGSADLSGFTTLGWLGPRQMICRGADAAVECDTLISSGTLVPLSVIDALGGMDERLFIDLVDTEWCLRAKARGYGAFGVCGAVLEHRLGETRRRLWIGRWRQVPRHQPFRYYYIFRNTLLLARRPYVPLKVVLFQAMWLAGLFLTFGIFGGSGELRMMLRGIADGLRGVTGKLEDQHQHQH